MICANCTMKATGERSEIGREAVELKPGEFLWTKPSPLDKNLLAKATAKGVPARTEKEPMGYYDRVSVPGLEARDADDQPARVRAKKKRSKTRSSRSPSRGDTTSKRRSSKFRPKRQEERL